MFSPSDIYTSSGSNLLYGCWTSDVSKFDPSSFYNWEQDNLPVYDLEERTHLLWERQGHPTSSLTGFALVVSSTGASSCNGRVFPSISACLERLPDNINAPYLIEVADFGSLGNLILSNKTFGPRGSIEIINRNFAKAEPHTASLVLNKQNSILSNSYHLASSIQIADSTLATGHGIGLKVPSLWKDFMITSSVIVSSLVFSASPDARLTNNLTAFSRKASLITQQRLSAALAVRNGTTPWSASLPASALVAFQVYEQNPISEDSINLYDASCINEISNSEITWGSTDSTETITLGYGNRLSSLKILNCNGPIFIRNFTVDGGGYGGSNYGIEIVNSSNIHLENCSVTRCSKAGLLVENSKLVLTRGFVAYRNYAYTTGGVRAGIPWLSKIKSTRNPSTSSTLLSSINAEEGAGILALNSEINFSSTYANDTTVFSAASQYYNDGYLSYTTTPPTPAYDWLFCLSRNSIGLHAVNSTIKGGQREHNGISTQPYFDACNLYAELNTEAGIKLENSNFEFGGKLLALGNFRGLEAVNSKINTDHFIVRYNQKEGCFLTNSILKYNKDLYFPENGNAMTTIEIQVHQNAYALNGTHIKLDNSIYEPYITSSMPSHFERFIASASFGVDQNQLTSGTTLPGIILTNGSRLQMVHPGIETPDAFLYERKPLFGAAVSVDNRSELILQGSQSYTSKIVGPSTFNYQKRKAGLCANNNSKITINGPTVIARYAVDILVDNNSELNICPHRNSTGGLDISGFNLANGLNHTAVELHATRACLVANNNSIINMKDLGDYRSKWANGAYGTAALLSGVDYLTNDSTELNYQSFTSSGSLQFYPNPNDSIHYPPAIENPTISLYSNNTMGTTANGYRYFFEDGVGDVAQQNNFSSITFGGMCLRALNGSKVNATNVHFPAGHWNPSGIIYDVSGADSTVLCNRLFIWNIADSSQLNAKLISVSGLHPADAAYFGPSGTWGSASSAPTSTPDTSSVSILDLYGRATNHLYGKSTATNQGPFRLYFSIDPAANWLVATDSTLSGFAPQVFSQGYQFSGNLLAPGNVSAFYMSVLKQTGSTLAPSGFYYASAMVFSPETIKAILDDSAANTFANAKHCSVGKSGLAKLVSIYFPYTGTYGGDSAQSSSKQYGRGLRSVNSFDLERDN